MSVTTTNNVVINKLTLAQYKTLKANNQINANEVYSISDIDEHLIEMKDISNQNLNNISGDIIVGYGNDCTNKPVQNGYLINLPHSTDATNYNKQIWFARNSGNVYCRDKEAGVWGSWNKISQAPNIMTAYLSSNLTISSANASAYKNFTLSKYESAGDRLTISGGGIRVGANVSKIKVSAQSQVVPAGGAGIKHLRIYKNSATVGWATQRFTATNENATLTIPTRVLSVSEGDIIYLKYYALAGDVFNGSGDIPTMLTVEVVE